MQSTSAAGTVVDFSAVRGSSAAICTAVVDAFSPEDALSSVRLDVQNFTPPFAAAAEESLSFTPGFGASKRPTRVLIPRPQSLPDVIESILALSAPASRAPPPPRSCARR